MRHRPLISSPHLPGVYEMHEDLSRNEEVKGSSERSFGYVIAVFFVIVGLAPLFHSQSESPRRWALATALVFAILARWWNEPLAPLNRIWIKFGLFIYHIVNPIVLGLLFYSTVMPIGLILRAFGKDLLKLRFAPEANSYWIARQRSSPIDDSMKQQF
jgi:hypothetical protein